MSTRSGLARLGTHVSGSLERVRTSGDAAVAERVRAKLVAGDGRPPARAWKIRRAPVAALVAAAAAVVVAFFTTTKSADKSTLSFVVNGGDKDETGVVGAFLAAPPARELPVSFSDGTRVQVAAGARARVAELKPRGAKLLVESGVIHAQVVHREDTEWFVDAGPFEVKVTGTRFDVAWQPADEAIVVTLHEGSVVVTGCGVGDSASGTRVTAGMQLRASCKHGGVTLAPIEDGAGGATTKVADAEAVTTTPARLPDAPDAPPKPSAGTSDAPNANASAKAVVPSVTGSVSAAIVLDGQTRAGDMLAQANADRYAGRIDAAVSALERVRTQFSGTEAAATAAFELGRIAFDARKDFGAAGDWFDVYLRERPRGGLAREALGRAIEARQRSGDAARAKELAQKYLAAHPDGPHAALARRLAGDPGAEKDPGATP